MEELKMATNNEFNLDAEIYGGYCAFWHETPEDSDPPIIQESNFQEKESVNFVKFVREQSEIEDDRWSLLESTPTIPEDIIQIMPTILRDTAGYFNKIVRERDIFLTGAIGTLSACFPRIYGIYHDRKVFSNLNTFIAAPPASGKGVLTESLNLVGYIHAEKRKQSERIKLEIQGKSSNNEDVNQKNIHIPEILFVIPGNSSYSAIIDLLKDNKGIGVICETEADTLNNVLKQDWGNYSELIRNVTHHETIRQARKGTGYVEINKPKVSIVLSGTPGQLTRFIPSTEDGLFSRFLYYIFAADPVWSDPSPETSRVPSDKFFKFWATYVNAAYNRFLDSDREFRLSKNHWEHLNHKFGCRTGELSILVGSDISGVIFRLGLFQYRLAMLLSILRAFEDKQFDPIICCNDIDYEISDRLIEVYLKHALIAYNLLPRKEIKGVTSGCKALFEKLPCDIPIQRMEAVSIGSTLSMSEGAVDKYLRRLLEIGLLNSPVSGKYLKKGT